MVFSSLLFVFLFFTANIITQAVIKNVDTKNKVMLGFSLVFYAWAGLRYLPLLLGMTFICWFFALRIAGNQDEKRRKLFLGICVALCLLILGIFKYLGFILGEIQIFTGVPEVIPNIVLPIGISFYTFQLISYAVDVYRGDTEPQRKYWLLLLYSSLFHQCIAGPIVRYRDIANDIRTRRTKPFEISIGITRFTVGLAKKAVLANGCAAIADKFFAADTVGTASACGIWLGALCYMLQIYLDFSAYSDMAIGMGLMCGFHYKENFDYPYMADSVTDFWRRWHISLSSFFRDYVYIPLGGNRCSETRQMLNLLAVWFLTGLWHGASWNYIIWGLYYFVFLLVEKFIWPGFNKVRPALRRVIVLAVVFFGWVIFRFEDLSVLGSAFRGMFCLNHNSFHDAVTGLEFSNNIFFIIFCVIAVTPLGRYLKRVFANIAKDKAPLLYIYAGVDAVIPIGLLLLSMMALAGNSYNPFLYFQF